MFSYPSFLLPNCVSHPRCSPCQDSPPGGRERCTHVQGQQPLHPRGPSSWGDLLLGPEGLPLRRYHLQEAGVVMEASRVSSSQDESSLLPPVPPRSHDLGIPVELQRLFVLPSASSGSSTYATNISSTGDLYPAEPFH